MPRGLLLASVWALASAPPPRTVIVEEHHHALAYWYEAARAAQPHQPALLLHLDTHDDLAMPRSGSSAPWQEGGEPNGFITRNDVFIMDAVVRGLVDEMAYVRLADAEEAAWYAERYGEGGNVAEDSGVVLAGVVMVRDGAGQGQPALWSEGSSTRGAAAPVFGSGRNAVALAQAS